MPLLTSVVGSFPKPEYVRMPDWFRLKHCQYTPALMNQWLEDRTDEDSELLECAVKEVLDLQNEIGIDIPTDGELRRENYIHSFCRHLEGINFKTLAKKKARDGALEIDLPVIVGKIKNPESKAFAIVEEWQKSQKYCSKPLKITIPGPMTIADTLMNQFYSSENDPQLLRDLANVINEQAQALVEAGCTQIQIDEPIFVRKPELTLNEGIECLRICFKNIPSSVTKTIHMCCGYPNYLDQKDYLKADPKAYFQLAEPIDNLECIDVVSLEDAHRYNDCTLFGKFKRTKVMLGVVKIASSQVESCEMIKDRVEQVLEFIPKERLMLAPDCGLGFLPKQILIDKLKNMSEVAKSL